MSFRQSKSDQHAGRQAWRLWLSTNGAALKTIGLPPEVTLTRAHFIDFLQNGYLELHPESSTGFSLDEMNLDQMRSLRVILEGSQEFSKEPLVGWMRERIRQETNR